MNKKVFEIYIIFWVKEIMKLVRYGLELENDKTIEHEVILLVVDKKTYEYYINSNIKLDSLKTDVIKVEILTNWFICIWQFLE